MQWNFLYLRLPHPMKVIMSFRIPNKNCYQILLWMNTRQIDQGYDVDQLVNLKEEKSVKMGTFIGVIKRFVWCLDVYISVVYFSKWEKMLNFKHVADYSECKKFYIPQLTSAALIDGLTLHWKSSDIISSFIFIRIVLIYYLGLTLVDMPLHIFCDFV